MPAEQNSADIFRPDYLARLDEVLAHMTPEALAHFDRVYGVDQPPEPLPGPTAPPTPGVGEYLRESFAGLQNQPQAPAQSFGAGLVGGLIRGLGSAGSRALAQRQQLEDMFHVKQSEVDAANQKATAEFRANRQRARGELVTKMALEAMKPAPKTDAQIEATAMARQKGTEEGKAFGPQPAVKSDAQDDPKAVAQMLYDGRLQPTYLSGRPTQYTNRILGELNKIDPSFNLTKATLDYVGTNQFYKSLNQAGQLRFRQSATNAGHTVDAASTLMDQLYSVIPPQQIKAFNKAEFNAVLNGGFGKQAAGIAQELLTHSGALQSEMASVYSGGNAPTDDSRKIAAEGINGKAPVGLLRSGLNASRRAINIRLRSVAEQGPVSPSNPAPSSLEEASARAGRPTTIGRGTVGGSSAARAAPQAVIVNVPGGRSYSFPDAESAARFKAAAGIP
jgi:hypothetical protein